MSDWSEKTVKCQAVIKNRTCFPFKRYRQEEKRNLSEGLKVTHPIMRSTMQSKSLALYKAYTSPI